MKHGLRIGYIGLGSIALLFMIISPVWATNGHVLHGVGSVNQSMGGAGIATSIDAIGSNHNNVSSISFLDQSSMEFSFETFIPDRTMSADSGVGGSSGSVESKTREAVIPSIGITGKGKGPFTFGLSAFGIAGFGVDYPANPAGAGANPVAAPQSAGGFGSIFSNYQLLQVTPSAAYMLMPNLSVGFGFNVNYAYLSIDPWPATPPNLSGFPTGTHTATAWGYGFTVGATYLPFQNLALGAVFKSPQWFDKFRYNSQFPDGTPTGFTFELDYPMIVGGGVSYKPIAPLTLAADVKWINYTDTDGFEKENFASSPSGPFVQGFGWESIWTVSLGAQYMITPKLAFRSGYNYGENPIPPEQQFFNVFAPAIVKHHLTLGAGYQFTPSIGLNFSYYHAFKENVTGGIICNGDPTACPPGVSINEPIPGTSVTNELSENSASVQLSYTF